MTRWLDRVRAGDLQALPKSFSWNGSAEVAHVIDGYAIAGSTEALFDLARRVMAAVEVGEGEREAAISLWLTLFAEHRGRRHDGYPPTKDERRRLDRLCQDLRIALLRANESERAEIVSKFALEGEPHASL